MNIGEKVKNLRNEQGMTLKISYLKPPVCQPASYRSSSGGLQRLRLNIYQVSQIYLK